MQTSEYWQSLFENWPDVIKRRGVVISTQGEAIPFANFLISAGLLLIDRDGPDAGGARKIIVAYDSIAMVKLPTIGEVSLFQSMGFQPPL